MSAVTGPIILKDLVNTEWLFLFELLTRSRSMVPERSSDGSSCYGSHPSRARYRHKEEIAEHMLWVLKIGIGGRLLQPHAGRGFGHPAADFVSQHFSR